MSIHFVPVVRLFIDVILGFKVGRLQSVTRVRRRHVARLADKPSVSRHAFRPLLALCWKINPSVCSTAVHYILQTAGYRAIADPGYCLPSHPKVQ